MIFTLRPPRRHDFLCDGGAIGNDGNKCETVTPHSQPQYLYVPCAFKVVGSQVGPRHKIRNKSSPSSLAIKYKKQLR